MSAQEIKVTVFGTNKKVIIKDSPFEGTEFLDLASRNISKILETLIKTVEGKKVLQDDCIAADVYTDLGSLAMLAIASSLFLRTNADPLDVITTEAVIFIYDINAPAEFHNSHVGVSLRNSLGFGGFHQVLLRSKDKVDEDMLSVLEFNSLELLRNYQKQLFCTPFDECDIQDYSSKFPVPIGKSTWDVTSGFDYIGELDVPQGFRLPEWVSANFGSVAVDSNRIEIEELGVSFNRREV
jgi:hypothetical protein